MSVFWSDPSAEVEVVEDCRGDRKDPVWVWWNIALTLVALLTSIQKKGLELMLGSASNLLKINTFVINMGIWMILKMKIPNGPTFCFLFTQSYLISLLIMLILAMKSSLEFILALLMTSKNCLSTGMAYWFWPTVVNLVIFFIWKNMRGKMLVRKTRHTPRATAQRGMSAADIKASR